MRTVIITLAAVLALAGCAGDPEPPAARPSSTTTTTPPPSPEDSYINTLDRTGLIPGVTGSVRSVWIRTGRTACRLLKINGNVVTTRIKIGGMLVDYSGEGWAEEGLAERAVAVVAAAQLHLCPEVSAS